MSSKPSGMRGFTLIASLLVLVLLSGVAVGLMFLVNSQQHVGSNDTEDNLAFYGAESGMEKLTSDVSALYAQTQNPTPAAVANLANFPPTYGMVGPINYVESIAQQVVGGVPVRRSNVISSGPEQGLTALTIPMNLQVQATRPGSNASVNMFRTIELAFIPVFQFGVFSDSDLSYFAGPVFDFAGRIHTNGNLFLSSGSSLIINGKVTTRGEVIRDRLANNHLTSAGYTGNVYIPDATNGCGAGAPALHCKDFTMGDGSWSQGIPPVGLPNNDPLYTAWIGISTGSGALDFNGFVLSGASGAKKLSLPFVQGSNAALGTSGQQILIVRKATVNDTPALTDSKLYNKAAIRILLADTQPLLHPERPGVLAEDIDLTGPDPNGKQIATSGGSTRIAMAHANNVAINEPGWSVPPTTAGQTLPDPLVAGNNWHLINGWIRVEYLNNANPPVWVGVTTEWLKYGFARGAAIPTTPSIPAGQPTSNQVHANAILLLQELRPGAATIYDTGAGSQSQYSWYPINFWDPREGLPRDTNGGLAGTQCTANGIMNAVELDVGNLNLWLQGQGAVYGAGSGTQVNSTVQNGYVLYFSDRRGMQVDPNATPGPSVNGEYGFEDVVNSATGLPDTVLEPVTAGYNHDSNNNVDYSPEDLDENGLADNWGTPNVGDGFPGTAATAGNPYQTVDCQAIGRQNIVTGARHVLKLVDGSLGNVPMAPPIATPTGGFTVASENPVYVEGDYNSNSLDPVWNTPSTDVTHAAAAIIADTVTLLSNYPVGAGNGWTDQKSMANPLSLASRVPVPTYYRVAIAAGKNMNFPQPAGTGNDYGTDGGVHNFLRLLENWGGTGLYYRGSLVSLYYSQYATGVFKCCNEVYGAPARHFSFDTDFLNPNNLPPGTPMLQDVNNLSERQDFTPQ